MNAQTYQSVFSTGNFLFAVAIQDALEEAGIPTRVIKSKNGCLSVEVPTEMIDQAQSLLFVEPRCGETPWMQAH